MVDNKTAHLALPLPDLSNMQDEDVPRISRAMSMLDAHAQKVDSALEAQGRDVEGLKAGSQAQAGSLDALSRALETEKTERAEADRAASTKLQELATGQDDLGQRVDTLGETSTDHGARLDAAEHGITAISTTQEGKANADLTNVTNNAIKLYFYAREEKPSGTGGGAASANTWHTRNLNTVLFNNIGASLVNNQVTLQPGTYYIRAETPGFGICGGRCALINVTSGEWMIGRTYWGTGQYAPHNLYISTETRVVLAVPSKFELRTWAEAQSDNGLGYRSNLAGTPEIYSEIRIWKM